MRLGVVIKSLIIFPIISACIAVVPLISENQYVLAKREMSLDHRYNNTYVNNVFKNNILLTLAYMAGKVHTKSDIDWIEINKPFTLNITLQPGEIFAFHNDILASFKNRRVKTTNANFSAGEGFLSDGLLYGDGVCHLASLINWTANDARLSVFAPTRHDFANIPEIPKEYGVSIYTSRVHDLNSQRQNLYIENTQSYPVILIFDYKDGVLSVSISEIE